MDSTLVSLVSACTALVASIVGPIVTLAVARRQFSASVLSANRQKWIETLRDTLAELISLLVALIVVKAHWQGKWDHGMAPISADPGLLQKLERIVLQEWQIRLLLNPLKQDHQEMYRAIDSVFAGIRSEEAQDDAQVNADIERITAMAQAILKREWGRVKLGI